MLLKFNNNNNEKWVIVVLNISINKFFINVNNKILF